MVSLSRVGPCVVFSLLIATSSFAQAVALAPDALLPVQVNVEKTTWKGQDAIRLTETPQAGETIAIVRDSRFLDGTIELEVAGMPAASAGPGARGFIGVAFRVQNTEPVRYECFYLRPTNGRADDQVRRNHSTQYISHPEYPWHRLRREFPEKYESYVDLEPGEWTKVKLVVKGGTAQLFVHGAAQPSLIVNDLKQPVEAGAVALWIGQGTEGYFRSLSVTPDRP